MTWPREGFDPVMLQTFDITAKRVRKLPWPVGAVKRMLNATRVRWSKLARAQIQDAKQD
jgi:hypothetical protein